jgi:nicotinate-nucleotide adenylyltransferase
MIDPKDKPRRIAFFGGSFDPPHRGHLAIADALLREFALDQFVFLPAFRAPHKMRSKPTSAYDRYAMLCLATNDNARITVSRMEIEVPERPFSVETLSRLTAEMPSDELFFVMGADSWMDITSWREWEKVLSLVCHIVVTRPANRIDVSHVTDEIRERIIDLRGGGSSLHQTVSTRGSIFITDAVELDISATDIRRRIREDDATWRDRVTDEVAIYIEKYQIYN